MSVKFWLHVTNYGQKMFIVDSEEHKEVVLNQYIRYRRNHDLYGHFTGESIAFGPRKGQGPKLKHSVPATLHGPKYQNARRIGSDFGDLRKSNYAVPKRGTK